MAITFKGFGKLVQKTLESNTVAFQREFTASMGQAYAADTPLDTGSATGNWHGSVNATDLTHKDRFDKSLTAFKTKKAILNDLSTLGYKDTAYVQNAVKGDEGDGYIIKLEKGGSRQARFGMFDINNSQAKTIARKSKKRLK